MNEPDGGGGPPAPAPPPLPSGREPSFNPPGWQEPQSFPEPSFNPPGWQPPADTSINARPHMMEGQYWVSFDRQHWWNGAMWMPGLPPGQGRPTFPTNAPGGAGMVATIVGLIAFGLFALFAFGICTSMQQSGIPGAPMP